MIHKTFGMLGDFTECPCCRDSINEGFTYRQLIVPSSDKEFDTVKETCDSCGAELTLFRIGNRVEVTGHSED